MMATERQRAITDLIRWLNSNDSPAHLPISHKQRTIVDMAPGDEGWTVPWAMAVDEDRACWLDAFGTVRPEPIGTARMRVRRTGTGWHVVLPSDYSWDPGLGRKHGWLPVESVETGRAARNQ